MRRTFQYVLLLVGLIFCGLTGYNLILFAFDHPPEKKSAELFTISVFQPPSLDSLPDTLFIDRFETENDLNNMILLDGPLRSELVKYEQASNDCGIKLVYDSARYVEVAFNYAPPWWNQYDSLILNVFRPEGKIIEISFRAGDLYTSDGYCVKCQKFHDLVAVRPGHKRLAYSIDSIGSLIDIESHFKSLHIGFNPREANQMIFYDFMLVKNAE